LLLRGHPLHMDWGLSREAYGNLLERTTGIVQWWRGVDARRSDSELAAECLAMNREFVEFCKASRKLKSALYFSTTAVSGTRRGLVREAELDHGQRFRSELDRAMASGEQMLQRHLTEMPLTVLRSACLAVDDGMVAPSASDPLARLVSVLATRPGEVFRWARDRSRTPFQLVPLSFALQVVRQLLLADDGTLGTYHLRERGETPDRP
jgi:hypothetical protein